MAIDTNLNVDPYYDDFNEDKQFNKILFRPARAVQARELTQLQSILQNQVERFGSNIYKEGTILSGVNLTVRSDIKYVKLSDNRTFTDPTLYAPTDTQTYLIEGSTSLLRAEIISATNGFETQSPDLKTFYIKYLNTGVTDKEFLQGESLQLINSATGLPVSGVSVTVANVVDHAGSSFGISCEEGVIYQKGHFIFVSPQFAIVKKYIPNPNTSPVEPNGISVGFTVTENLVNSNQDTSLLDNASGFNNENAPGADRLQLVPTLTVVDSDNESDTFFSLIRFQNGEPVRIRDLTEFNTIGTELARRTYEESGNYVVEGFKVRLEDNELNSAIAVVEPGKAYVFGHEVRNLKAKRIPIEGTQATQTKEGQSTGINYGQYYTFNAAENLLINQFLLDGTEYILYEGGPQGSGTIIGSASIASITPGRIYVYNVQKISGKENTAPSHILSTPLTSEGTDPAGTIYGLNTGGRIFDLGKSSLQSVENVSFVVRKSITASTTPTASTVVLPYVANSKAPLVSNVLLISDSNLVVSQSTPAVYTGTFGGSDVTVTTGENFAGKIYYDERIFGVSNDTLNELDVYVNSTFIASTGFAQIGLPNVIQLLEVFEVPDLASSPEIDVTGRFALVNNQKDHFYDLSYLRLKVGETLADGASIRIKVKALSRTSVNGSGYLSADSYSTVSTNLLRTFESRDGTLYNVKNCLDFRPYASPVVSYAQSPTGASDVSNAPVVALKKTNIPISSNHQITSKQTYYLSRIDNVVIDEFGDISIFKGAESESPSRPALKNLYPISRISIPGNSVSSKGLNPVKMVSVSNKNYTMKDISELDKRIKRLITTVSLSLLELQAKNIFIPDEEGLDRFKTGILVDPCRNLSIANITDPEFRCAIDKTRTVITPAVTQYPIDLAILGGSGFEAYSNVAALVKAGQADLFTQKYATQFRNCVTNFYSYNGKASIYPEFDVNYDNTSAPDVNIEIDLSSVTMAVIDNIQDFLPATREQSEDTSENLSGINQNTTTTASSNTSDEIQAISTDTVDTKIKVGNFITDITLTPFVASREVGIAVTGLRPNARHYFYFEEKDVNDSVWPGTLTDTGNSNTTSEILGSNVVKGVYTDSEGVVFNAAGSEIYADDNGTLLAVFQIPEETFFIGENTLEIVDVSSYQSIKSGKTSYARASYRAYNFNLEESGLNATTRSLQFASNEETQAERQYQQSSAEDPIAQTFYLKSPQAKTSNAVYVSELDLFFKSKSATAGVTVELREVVNGYPSKRVLPFGRKYLEPSDIEVSNDSSVKTTVKFSDPVKMTVEKEYCFVVVPSGNSPDYLIWTAKVGGTDEITRGAITNDWGDGAMFTSTNDSAWKSYQDEDIKFNLRRFDFNTTGTSYVNLVPNKVEFLTLNTLAGNFQKDEIVYSKTVDPGVTTEFDAEVGLGSQTVTIGVTTVFTASSYVILSDGNNTHVSKVSSVSVGTVNNITTTTLTIDTPWPYPSSTGATASYAVAGRVSFYNKKKPSKIHLKESSANSTYYFQTAKQVIGLVSGATGFIESIDNKDVSYIQPQVLVDNTSKTSSNIALYTIDTNDDQIKDTDLDSSANNYLLNKSRTINSTSNIGAGSVKNDFIVRVNMSNSESTATPLLDQDLSMLNVYEYFMSQTEDSSKYISREVILEEGFEAEGLRVIMSAYRPAGTVIDVYARYVYPTNADQQSDWLQLDNLSPDLFSNSSNPKDYREFTYVFDESGTTYPYTSFQVKIVLRWMTDSELEENEQAETDDDAQYLTSRGAGTFPHIYNYRAIALV